MEIHVLAEFMLNKFRPQTSTIAMRIFSSNDLYPKHKLENSNFIREYRYVFDDIDIVRSPEDNDKKFLKNYVLFNHKIARQIIQDFRASYSTRQKPDLMVHCFLGQSRSPGVAIALNEIFKLKNDLLAFQYPRYNLHVCYTLLDAAKDKAPV